MAVPTGAYVALVASCAIAYLVCGIPSAYLIGRFMAGVDVRKVGSGNVGSTNVVRAAGAKFGLLTLACDVAKAALSVAIGYGLLAGAAGLGLERVFPGGDLDWMMGLVYVFCIVGHVFTPYLRFKGGKGIAVGFGGAVVLAPLAGLSLWVPFLLFAATTRYISLGSIMAAVSLPFIMALIYHPSAAFLALMAAVSALVVFAHRDNVKKLLSGTESKFSFTKKAADTKGEDGQ